jgi:hypothetical protein
MWGGGSCMWEGRARTLAHHELSVAAKYLLRHRIKRSGSQHRKSQPVLNSGPDTYGMEVVRR